METKKMETISFKFTYTDLDIDKEIIREFTVPFDWANEWVNNNYEATVEEFMDEYTSEDSEPMYCDAMLAGVLIED